MTNVYNMSKQDFDNDNKRYQMIQNLFGTHHIKLNIIPADSMSKGRITSTDRLLLMSICKATNNSNRCLLGDKYLALTIGVSSQDVAKSVHNLELNGYITVNEYRVKNIGTFRNIIPTSNIIKKLPKEIQHEIKY